MADDNTNSLKARSMVWKSFLSGAAVAAVGIIALVLLWPKPAWHGYIDMPDLTLVGLQSGSPLGDEILDFSGAIVGPDLAFPNNIFKVKCLKSTMTCQTATLEQVADNEVGDIQQADFKITQWSPNYVEAVDDEFCGKITLGIDRKSRHIAYTQEPQNVHDRMCAKSNPDVRRYEIGRPTFWQKLDPKGHGLVE